MSRSRKTQHKQKKHTETKASGSGVWLVCIVILGGVLAYVSSFKGVFLLDDNPHIVENAHIRSLANLGDILATRRPIVTLSLAINYALGRLNPWGYHLFNLFVHLLAGMTLFAVVRRTLLTSRLLHPYGAASAWIAAIVSLLWVVHPLQTESVTYIIQRGEALMGLFYLLMLYCIIRGASVGASVEATASGSTRSKHRADTASAGLWYIAAIGCCALGMGSKAVMVTAPVVALMFDRIFLSRSLAQIFRHRWWLYVGLAATWGLLVATGVARGVLQKDVAATVGFGVRDVSAAKYALTQPEVIRHYLKLCIWPYPLCLDYKWLPVEGLAQAAGSLVGLLALITATVWALVRKPVLGFVGLWFFIILSPTSSFIPIRDLAFEHRMYLPLASVILVVVVGVFHVLKWMRRRFGFSEVGMYFSAAVLAIAVSGSLITATYLRNLDYRDEVSMWTSVIDMRPDHARAYSNRAAALITKHSYREAEADCRRTIELDPMIFGAYNSLGLILKSEGKFAEALACYEKALSLAGSRYQGQLHSNMVLPLLQLGRSADALWHGQKAVEFNAADAEGHNNYGMALWMNKKTAEAEAEYRAALAINPNLWQAYHNLGMIYSSRLEYERAIKNYKTALSFEPSYADSHYEIGAALLALSEQGRPELREQAIGKFRDAFRHNPSHRRSIQALAAMGGSPSATPAAQGGALPQ